MIYVLYFIEDVYNIGSYIIETNTPLKKEYLENLQNEAYHELSKLEESDEDFNTDFSLFVKDYMVKKLESDNYCLKDFKEIVVDLVDDEVLLGDEIGGYL